MKTPTNHPWKGKGRKVDAECVACGKEFKRDPEAGTKTCSVKCGEAYAVVRRRMHQMRGGFR